MQLSPRGCTGNYDLRLTIGRNARISSPSHPLMDKCQSGFGLVFCMYFGIKMYFSHLLMEQVEGKLKSDCLHVGPLEGGRDVHVHVKEPEQKSN